jgi:hypothetical protein
MWHKADEDDISSSIVFRASARSTSSGFCTTRWTSAGAFPDDPCCLRISCYRAGESLPQNPGYHVRVADSKSWHGQFRRRCLVRMGTDDGEAPARESISHRWGRPSPAGGPGVCTVVSHSRASLLHRTETDEKGPKRVCPNPLTLRRLHRTPHLPRRQSGKERVPEQRHLLDGVPCQEASEMSPLGRVGPIAQAPPASNRWASALNGGRGSWAVKKRRKRGPGAPARTS